jgi:hypothetical protein
MAHSDNALLELKIAGGWFDETDELLPVPVLVPRPKKLT